MGFKVRGKEDTVKDPDTVMWLKEDKGSVDLFAKLEGETDEQGQRILFISSSGTLWRPSGVNKKFGFRLNEIGRIQVQGQED